MTVKRSFKDAGADVDTFARMRMQADPSLTYKDACRAVLEGNHELAESYRNQPEPVPEDTSKYAQARTYTEACASLMEQAEDLTLRLGIDTNLAFKRVLTLDRNRLLAKRYLEGPTKRERQGR